MLKRDVREKLIAIVGEENVEDNNASLLAYSYDSTARYQALPDAMVAPRNKHEVAAVVKVCNEHRIPIVPRGSGTNLCAGTTPSEGGIVLIFKHMRKILEIDEENLTITVQSGVYTKDILEAAQQVGLFYPPDPGSMHISQIGGNISENSGGLRGLKYGVTRDYVLGLEIVLPNGEIIQTGGKLAKDVAGYDLTRLYVGAEGTLGVITEAILKLIPQPETKQTMLALYHDLEAAAESVSAIIANRIIPATLEFLDQATVQVVEDYAKIGLPTEAKAVLLIEQDGAAEVVARDMEKIATLCRDNRAFDVQVAQTNEEAEQLTAARRTALSALSRLKPTTILEDATVPRSKIAKMVKAIGEIAEKYQLTICTFGHAGDGNLHPTCLTDARNEQEIELVEKAFAEIFEKAVELGGTITGEHGVGMMKLPYLHLKAGEHGLEAMRSIKKALDPNAIMNPGKMFDPHTKQSTGVEK
ncbi:glycolate oxidase subunit GlcD [Virgibacillus pantothenticus]|uniref:FAD-binding protein n=1 Tax=Virgibacillus pantothenticus TaxID=1473 RepID=A0A0L0QLI7_VIRPA|nr:MULTISPECIES: glycolate oxidase subunit GlcD [Virgibacillus]API91355.1 glycolate oxidase subunit GlcD [Virgibacillus sp. 6R]KNE19118.1 FAD-binding protein [Virgibacillus pantothenticus]MBS7426593.1 glycolate oxidase subunit GlcD [Virgibacillus sp. 19R1-5]MBU8567222.1 glycolate oxidase subunit GlcD [Virgibacillus pantothenticus]MBU8599979.1 glycolate oxidase subunit GlcD [Virgibacillus pantothenticus]